MNAIADRIKLLMDNLQYVNRLVTNDCIKLVINNNLCDYTQN